jgi:hypothetical protein
VSEGTLVNLRPTFAWFRAEYQPYARRYTSVLGHSQTSRRECSMVRSSLNSGHLRPPKDASNGTHGTPPTTEASVNPADPRANRGGPSRFKHGGFKGFRGVDRQLQALVPAMTDVESTKGRRRLKGVHA